MSKHPVVKHNLLGTFSGVELYADIIPIPGYSGWVVPWHPTDLEHVPIELHTNVVEIARLLPSPSHGEGGMVRVYEAKVGYELTAQGVEHLRRQQAERAGSGADEGDDAPAPAKLVAV